MQRIIVIQSTDFVEKFQENLDVWAKFDRYVNLDGCIGKLGRLDY